MNAGPRVIGRLVLHPRRLDRLCVASGRQVLTSFARDQNRAEVTAILEGNGYAVCSDLNVTAPAIATGAPPVA